MNSSDFGSGFRYYSKAFNTNKSAPSFGYMYDAGLVYSSDGDSQTGAWRPAFPADFAANISVSGLNLTVGAVAITGNPQVQISNIPSVTLTNPVYQVGITGNNPIYVTGSFGTTSNGSTLVTGGVIGITGTTNVNIINPILAVSGSLSASISSVAVTGITNVTGFVVSVETGVRSVFITNSAPINVTGFITTIVTGAVSASFDSTSIVNAQVTGNQYLAFISGRELINSALLSGISGSLTTNLNSAAYVTGSVNVYNTLPLYVTGALSTNFTGNLSATIDSVPIVNAQTTGNNYLAFISDRELINGALLSGISGSLATNLDSAAWVTGQINIANIAPINVTGFVTTVVTGTISSTISNPIGVSGVSIDRALPSITGFNTQFLPIGGRAVNASGSGSITGYNAVGDMAILNISKDNGGLFVNQGALDYSQDNVTTVSSGLASVSNDAVSGLNQVLFPANPNRLAWYIQNLHTGALMVRFSTSFPTTGFMNILLKGGAAINDGNGASYSASPAIYKGAVSVTGFGGAPVLYTAWQI